VATVAPSQGRPAGSDGVGECVARDGRVRDVELDDPIGS
jgi:hypothetical protein